MHSCRYRLHSNVTIDDLTNDSVVCTAYGPAAVATPPTAGPASWHPAAGDPLTWPRDPRLSLLGRRVVLPTGDVGSGLGLGKGGAGGTGKGGAGRTGKGEAGGAGKGGDGWRAWRVQHGVAEGDTEMPSGTWMQSQHTHALVVGGYAGWLFLTVHHL